MFGRIDAVWLKGLFDYLITKCRRLKKASHSLFLYFLMLLDNGFVVFFRDFCNTALNVGTKVFAFRNKMHFASQVFYG